MRKHTASQQVFTLHHDFYIPQLNRNRTIYLYLPTDYAHTDKHYPVIYAQDGQNLFNEATAFHKEWKIDKTLNMLQKKGDYGAIVVGIANGGENRLSEYAAWHRPRMGGGEAEKYIDFIADTLKPYIDKHFKTLPAPSDTALLGSSMGGLFALYGAVRRSDVFGKVSALSPSLWFNPQVYDFVKQHAKPYQKLYVSGSQTESRFMQESLQSVYWSLHHAGLPDAHIRVVLRDRGKHNEIFWGAEFKKMYAWLFA